MSRYLIIWESNPSRFPIDPKEMASIVEKFTGMTKQAIQEGKISSWGEFVGGGKGYSVVEGNAAEVYKSVISYFPYFTMQVQEVLSIEEVANAFK